MIQIDMQMPEACDVCPFNYDFCLCKAFGTYDEWEKYSDDWNDHVCDRETRPEYCPLKEQKVQGELKLKMLNALYAKQDEYEKKFVGKGEHLNWFTVYRPWLQKGFDIAINAIADWEGR